MITNLPPPSAEWQAFMSPEIIWRHADEFDDAFEALMKEEHTMTTAVTVNAHAGRPVLVTLKYGEPLAAKSVSTELVEPNTERTFYIHSGLQIIGVEEQPMQAPAPASVSIEAIE